MEDRQQKIELYITGDLTGDALKAFEQALLTDKDLARDVRIAKDLEQAFQDAHFEDILSPELTALGKEFIPDTSLNALKKESKTNYLFFHRYKWGIAASILLLVSMGIIWMWSNKGMNSEDLYVAYYEPYQTTQLTRSTTSMNELNRNIIEQYDNKNYSEVITLIESNLDSFSNKATMQLLLGNCYLNVVPSQMDKSISLFQQLANQEGKLYTNAANWYLAMTYLKAQQQEKAIPILKQLAKKGVGKYPKLAQQLLSEK